MQQDVCELALPWLLMVPDGYKESCAIMGSPGVKARRNISPASAMPERGGTEDKYDGACWEGWSKCFAGSSWDSQPWVTCLMQADLVLPCL